MIKYNYETKITIIFLKFHLFFYACNAISFNRILYFIYNYIYII